MLSLITKYLKEDIREENITLEEAALIFSYYNLHSDKVFIPGTGDFYISRSALWTIGSKMRQYIRGLGPAPEYISIDLAHKVLYCCDVIDGFLDLHHIQFAEMTYDERSSFDDSER